jgi:IS30 family transposase
MRYTHLSQTERYQIYTMLNLNCRIIEIAQHLERHESTIRREILRNSGQSGYRAFQAHVMSSVRSIGSRNATRVPHILWPRVEAFLSVQHSPEQISSYLPISHESIYQHIYRDRSRRLRSFLRCQKKKRRCYAGNRSLSTGPIANRRGIELRPASVELRARIGHWEVDTIIGKGHKGVIVTLVERKSGFTLLKLLPNKTAPVVSAAMIELLMPFKHMVKTITSDNGCEFAMHEAVDAALGCTSYFARPYASWQRGTNENTNGLVRQYVPKSRKFNTVTGKEIEMIQNRLNHRPRKRLGFNTPDQVFYTSFDRRALRV